MSHDYRTTQLLVRLGLSEGGLVDHPNDPGGRTNMGVTQRVYNAWRRRQGLSTRAVDHITKQEADMIFVDQYFLPLKYTELPLGLDYTVVDFGINSGVGRSGKYLQAAINKLVPASMRIAVDGIIGNVTLDTIEHLQTQGKIVDLIDQINDDRLAFMKRAKNPKTGKRLWPSFGKGWSRRVADVRAQSKLDHLGRKTVEPIKLKPTPKAEAEYRTWFQRLLWPDQ